MNTSDTRERAVQRTVTLQHVEVSTGLSFEDASAAFEREVGHLDPAVTKGLVARRADWSEVEREIGAVGGVHGLMIVARANQGLVTSLSGQEKRCTLYIVGNPTIADRILDIDIRASFYVPFRVALYDDPAAGGAVIAYDRPSSFLASLEHPELAKFGETLDGKIDAVLAAICGGKPRS